MDALKHGPLDPPTAVQPLGDTSIPSAQQPPFSPRELFSCSSTPQHDGELPRSAPPPHPACLGQGTGAELPPWGRAGAHRISSLSLSGVHKQERGGPAVGGSSGVCPEGCCGMLHGLDAALLGKHSLFGWQQPSSPGGSQSGNRRSRVRHKAPRCARASPRPSAIPESARSMGAFSLSFSFPSRHALQPSQNPAFVRIF